MYRGASEGAVTADRSSPSRSVSLGPFEPDVAALRDMLRRLDERFHTHSDDIHLTEMHAAQERQLRMREMESKQLALQRLCGAAILEYTQHEETIAPPHIGHGAEMSTSRLAQRVEAGIVSTPRSQEEVHGPPRPSTDSQQRFHEARSSVTIPARPLQRRRRQARPPPPPPPPVSSASFSFGSPLPLRPPTRYDDASPSQTEMNGLEEERRVLDAFFALTPNDPPAPALREVGPTQNHEAPEGRPHDALPMTHPYASGMDATRRGMGSRQPLMLPARGSVVTKPRTRSPPGLIPSISTHAASRDHFDAHEEEELMRQLLSRQKRGAEAEEERKAESQIVPVREKARPHSPSPFLYSISRADSLSSASSASVHGSVTLRSNTATSHSDAVHLPRGGVSAQRVRPPHAPRGSSSFPEDSTHRPSPNQDHTVVLEENETLHRELAVQDGALRELTNKAETLARHLVRSMKERAQLQNRLERADALLAAANEEMGQLQRAQEEGSASLQGEMAWRAALTVKERELRVCEAEMCRLRELIERHVARDRTDHSTRLGNGVHAGIRHGHTPNDSNHDNNHNNNSMDSNTNSGHTSLNGTYRETGRGDGGVSADTERLLMELAEVHIERREAESAARRVADELVAAQSHIELLDRRLAEAERAAATARLHALRHAPSDSVERLDGGRGATHWPLDAQRAVARLEARVEGLALQHAESDRHAELRLRGAKREVDELRQRVDALQSESAALEADLCAGRRRLVRAQRSEGRCRQQLHDVKDDAALLSALMRTTLDGAESARRQLTLGEKVEVESFLRGLVRDWGAVERFLSVLQHMRVEGDEREDGTTPPTLSEAVLRRREFVMRAMERAMAERDDGFPQQRKQQQQQQQQQPLSTREAKEEREWTTHGVAVPPPLPEPSVGTPRSSAPHTHKPPKPQGQQHEPPARVLHLHLDDSVDSHDAREWPLPAWHAHCREARGHPAPRHGTLPPPPSPPPSASHTRPPPPPSWEEVKLDNRSGSHEQLGGYDRHPSSHATEREGYRMRQEQTRRVLSAPMTTPNAMAPSPTREELEALDEDEDAVSDTLDPPSMSTREIGRDTLQGSAREERLLQSQQQLQQERVGREWQLRPQDARQEESPVLRQRSPPESLSAHVDNDDVGRKQGLEEERNVEERKRKWKEEMQRESERQREEEERQRREEERRRQEEMQRESERRQREEERREEERQRREAERMHEETHRREREELERRKREKEAEETKQRAKEEEEEKREQEQRRRREEEMERLEKEKEHQQEVPMSLQRQEAVDGVDDAQHTANVPSTPLRLPDAPANPSADDSNSEPRLKLSLQIPPQPKPLGLPTQNESSSLEQKPPDTRSRRNSWSVASSSTTGNSEGRPMTPLEVWRHKHAEMLSSKHAERETHTPHETGETTAGPNGTSEETNKTETVEGDTVGPAPRLNRRPCNNAASTAPTLSEPRRTATGVMSTNATQLEGGKKESGTPPPRRRPSAAGMDLPSLHHPGMLNRSAGGGGK